MNNIIGSKYTIGTALCVGAVTAAGLMVWHHVKKIQNTPPKKWRRVGELSEIYVYPIKSCKGTPFSQIQCTKIGSENGLMRDRIFMIFTSKGEIVTARPYPKMVLISVSFDGENMILSAPDVPDFVFDTNQLSTRPKTLSVMDGYEVDTVDCGDEVGAWLSRYVNGDESSLRLRFYPHRVATRPVHPSNLKFKLITPSHVGALHDCASYMMINENSVIDLNSRLEADGQSKPLQFRPNFVVKGAPAFAEDNWKWIRIGDNVIFRNLAPCLRCIFININPETGLRNSKFEPLKTLKGYRLTVPKDSSPAMGVLLGVNEIGLVSLGDSVYVEDD